MTLKKSVSPLVLSNGMARGGDNSSNASSDGSANFQRNTSPDSLVFYFLKFYCQESGRLFGQKVLFYLGHKYKCSTLQCDPFCLKTNIKVYEFEAVFHVMMV